MVASFRLASNHRLSRASHTTAVSALQNVNVTAQLTYQGSSINTAMPTAHALTLWFHTHVDFLLRPALEYSLPSSRLPIERRPIKSGSVTIEPIAFFEEGGKYWSAPY